MFYNNRRNSQSLSLLIKNVLSNRFFIYTIFIGIILSNSYNMRIVAEKNNLDFTIKNTRTNFEDQVKIISMSTLFWFMSGELFKSKKFSDELMYRGVFISSMLLMSNVYGFIEKESGMNESLSSESGAKTLLLYIGIPILSLVTLYIGLLIETFSYVNVKYNV